jgi:acetyl-CoA synthetase
MREADETNSPEYVWQPSPEMILESNITAFMQSLSVADYDGLIELASQDCEKFWSAIMTFLDFHEPYSQLLDVSRGIPFAKWCVGGKTNIVLNCLDRHRGTPIWTQEVLAWQGESGKVVRWTYSTLSAEVSRLAHSLLKLGLKQGDVVGLFLPTIPQAISSYLACAKVGLVALPLFSGFGEVAVADRLRAAGARAVITADGTWRRGVIPMKLTVDQAAKSLPHLGSVIVVRNTGMPISWMEGRDHWLHELNQSSDPEFPTVPLSSDSPLMLMYTSGTTGSPKGTVHTHVGFAAKMHLDVGLIMDLKPSDRLLWMSDMGWLVGPIVAVAVPLHGASMVIAEGSPDYPDKARMWRLIDTFRVTFLGIAPTMARSFIKNHGANVEDYQLASLRICVSTGEVWTPEAWHWTFGKVCKGRVPILNYSGGTETGGGILSGTVVHPIKPCAFSRVVPGMGAEIVSGEGEKVGCGVMGELVLTVPSPGMTQTLWKHDDQRFLLSYWTDFPGMWRHGDLVSKDDDGYWYIHGRSDDTLKIAGKRTGPSEIESLLAGTGLVAESAVVGLPDDVKGQCVVCVVTLMPGVVFDASIRERLIKVVVDGAGPPFRPKEIIEVTDLPKTRNMKVMRRVVRTTLLGLPPGDLSSLVNPEAVEKLRAAIKQ